MANLQSFQREETLNQGEWNTRDNCGFNMRTGPSSSRPNIFLRVRNQFLIFNETYIFVRISLFLFFKEKQPLLEIISLLLSLSFYIPFHPLAKAERKPPDPPLFLSAYATCHETVQGMGKMEIKAVIPCQKQIPVSPMTNPTA